MTKNSSRRPKTFSIGGATYDLFVQTGLQLEDKDADAIRLRLGDKIKVQSVVETCGGGASNSSVGLQRLGCDASFCGIVGDDQWGQRLVENLQKEGVNTESVTTVEDETSSFSIILRAATGERSILYTAGTNEHLHDANFDKAAAAYADWIYLNHIQETACMIQDDLIELIHTAAPRIGLTWNPGGCQLTQGMKAKDNAELLRHTRLLLLNKEEALKFTGATSVDDALALLTAAGAKIVCISDGKRGSIASDGKGIVRCPIINDAPVIDTTGAGDAFGVGATWALLRGESLQTLLRAGTINATSVLSQIGAQAGLLTDIEMQARLKAVQLDVETRAL